MMDEILKFLLEIVKESGKIQRDYFEKKFAVHHKGEINLVTEVDIACQDRIIELISRNFPDDEVIAEEKENLYEGKRNRWIVDPLDGTTNYAHGYPFFCTSIAYEVGGEIQYGVVYNPLFEELFYTVKGAGAFYRGEKIHVSSVPNLRASLLSTGFPYDLATNRHNNVDNFLNFLDKSQAIRRDGSAALNLCYVACGRFDGHWEMRLNPWDLAAGALIVEEAGGTVTDLGGGEFSVYRGDVLATNGIIHRQMLDVLREGK